MLDADKELIRDFNSDEVKIRMNDEKNGVEVKFLSISLAREQNALVKENGFKWSGRQQLWYSKQSERAMNYALNLRNSISLKKEQNEEKNLSENDVDSLVETDMKHSIENGLKFEVVDETEKFKSKDEELEALLKQQEELSKRIEELKAEKEIEESTSKEFNPMDFLETFDTNSLEENNFIDYIVNNYNYSYLHTSEKQEAQNESTESKDKQTSESKDDWETDRQGSERYNLEQYDNRNSSDLGRTSRRNDRGTGYGNDISLSEESRKSERPDNVSYASGNDSVSSGYVRQDSKEQVSNGRSTVLPERMQEGALGAELSELAGSPESTGHGNELLDNEVITSKSKMRSIREQCKEILKKADSEITDEEKKLLALYEGGGGLKEKDATVHEALDAFYTPRNLVKAVWDIVDYYAPDGKTVLEPSSGIGRFAEERPNNQFTLREYDETSSRIAKILHPDAEVIQGAFQAQFFDENGIFHNADFKLPKYDIVIGNPPYGTYSGEWKGKGEGVEFDRYEEYFIAKGLDSLKDEKSLLAFVVPSGFLNSSNDFQKKLIASKGQLVDAYRLPEGTFGTTDVGTDIIVMELLNPNSLVAFGGETLSNNDWFINHPEKILGEVKNRINRFGKEESYVTVHEGLTVQDELDKLSRHFQNLKEDLNIVLNNNTEQESVVITEKEEKIQDQEKVEEPVESKIIESTENTEKKSFIQKSFESLNKTKSENLVNDDRAISVAWNTQNPKPIMDIKLKSIDDTMYRRMKDDIPWNFYVIFDIDSKSSVLTSFGEFRHNGSREDVIWKFAEIDGKGKLKLHYDRLDSDYTDLSPAKRSNLDSLIERYQGITKFISDKFIGLDDKNNFYFKDFDVYTTATNVYSLENKCKFLSFSDNDIKKIDFDSKNVRFSAISDFGFNNKRYLKNCYQDDSKTYNWYHGKPFYSSFNALYSKDGVDFKQVLEDDSFIKSVTDADVEEARKNSSKTVLDIPLNECLKLSHLTEEEYIEKIKSFNEEKQQKENEERLAEREILLTEQEWNPKLQKIIESNFEVNKEIPLSENNIESAVCSYDKDVKTQVNVFINDEPSFAVDEVKHVVTAFNDFPITTEFLDSMKKRWNGELSINESKASPEKLSLNKILEGKSYSHKQEVLSDVICDFVMDKENYSEKEGKISKSIEIENLSVTSVKNGTKIKVFFNGSRYSALEFDYKTNSLFINQDCYEKKIALTLEKSFLKKNLQNLSVVKDIVIDDKRYVDEDGFTIIASPKASRFNPEKENVLDNEQFASVYGKNWNKDERIFWEATDYKGYVDVSKLSDEQCSSLMESQNYVTEENGKIMHKELFASGNIYAKLEKNEENWNKGKLNNEQYERNRKILEDAKPKIILLKNISVSVISPFVENYEIDGVPLKEKFLHWATGCNIEDSPNTMDNITDFSISQVSRDDIPGTIRWKDVSDYVFNQDLERVKGIEDDEKRSQVRNQKKNDRKETAEKLFEKFIHTGLTKEEENDFVEKYNRTFNHEKAPDYSRLPLFVDGMNQYRKGKEFKLYEQQIKGISFLCNKGNGLLAYDVGLGKTAAGIVATVQQMQSGRASRPVIVVPKSVVGKWEDDIHELFPDVPVNNLGNLSREQVGMYYDGNHGLNIPHGSITLITKDALNNISFGKKIIDEYLFKDYADLLSLNDKLADDNPKERARAKELIYEKAGVAEQVKSRYYVQWDKTGFDHITVDEAHAYKNLFKVPRPKKGETSEFSEMGTGEPSKRALKMFNMTQIIQQQNENRNVFLLTATPFTNSALEVYSMLSYIARKELEQNGIKDLNDFCKQYAMTRYEKAVTKGGKDIKYKNVMKSFNDLPGLQNILKQYIDKVDGEEQEQNSIDFRHSFVRPRKETHTVFLENTNLQEKIFNFAVRVMDYTPSENDKNKRVAAGKKGVAPVLEAMNLMRTACLSPALVDAHKLNELLSMVDKEGEFSSIKIPPLSDVVTCSPKLKMVCDTVISNWKAHKDCGQVIYMPEGTEAYSHIIDYFVKNGIPKEVFATIDGSSCKIGGKNVTAKMIGSDSQEEDEDIGSDKRAWIAEKFNDRKHPCKILIGSSAISEGMDLNGNSIALYNCMLGWNPTEDVQVEGRIWRQGNEQGRVHIVYPLVYDSIDSLLYQKHSEKQSRINALFDYKDSSTLNVEDINPEELKYELIKDPEIRAKLEISDKTVEIRKQILLLDNQLEDYDQLIRSRIKYSEKLAEREANKESYISNYNASLAEGDAKRTPEEQKAGIERFDKAISDCKKQIENVRRKFAEMEIVTEEDERNFSQKIVNKKELLQKDIDSLLDRTYKIKVIEKYKKILNEEKINRIEKELTEPLDKTIQSQMKPMHIVEHEKKYEKYQKFMKIAQESNDVKMIETLNKNWKEYEDYYNEKYGAKKSSEKEVVEKPTVDVKVIEPKKEKVDENSIVNILQHEIETLDWSDYETNKSNDGTLLFPSFAMESIVQENKINKAISSQLNDEKVTVSNFAEKLRTVLSGSELSKVNVLKTVNKLITKMDTNEQKKFVTLTYQLGINTSEKTNEFFTKMAKGEIKLVPNKKPPVIRQNISEEETMDV